MTTKLIVGIDIDGTITQQPMLFKLMVDGILAAGGEVHFITARHEASRDFTLGQLLGWGFKVSDQYLHMFEEHYPWPYSDKETERHWRRTHGSWKADRAARLMLDVMIDDCSHVKIACAKAGIKVLHVFRA